MVQQSGRVMPRPVQVWVLDTVPGDVWCDGGDHPRDTIRFVSTLEPPFLGMWICKACRGAKFLPG